MRYNRFSYLAIAALLLSGCSRILEEDNLLPASGVVSFSASMAGSPLTRSGDGEIVLSSNDSLFEGLSFVSEPMDPMEVETRGSLVTNMYRKFAYSPAAGVAVSSASYNYDTDMYLSDQGDTYGDMGSSSIYCWAPMDVEGFSLTESGGSTFFRYTGKTNSWEQKDIVYGVATGVTADRATPLDVTFGHALCGVRVRAVDLFPIDGASSTVSGITLENVYTGGDFDPSTGVWTPQGKGNVSLISSNVTYEGSDKLLNDGEFTALLVPQELPSDAAISVIIDGNEYKASLSGILELGHVYVLAVRERPNYFYFEAAQANSTVKPYSSSSFSDVDLYYSSDKINWTLWNYSSSAAINLSNVGDRIYFKSSGYKKVAAYGLSSPKSNFTLTGKVIVGGDITTLVGSDNYVCSYFFYNCNSLVSAKDLVLPSQSLTSGCYYCMFYGCNNLIAAPVLSPLILSEFCCTGMFYNCSSLIDISGISLPATVLPRFCYGSDSSISTAKGMFEGCSKITSAPAMAPTIVSKSSCGNMFKSCWNLIDVSDIILPATTLEESCYKQMFYGCSKITSAPAMAPTTVAKSSCESMFNNCSSLTDISDISLPATTLEESCYKQMFYGCSKITSAPAMAPTTVAKSSCESTFNNCSSLMDISGISLPATMLEESCYKQMFYGCSKITSAPAMAPMTVSKECCRGMFARCSLLTDASNISLPSTVLAEGCYHQMFCECSSLLDISNITLSALTLDKMCYSQMFFGCKSLTSAPAMAPTTVAKECCTGMFYYCTSLVDVSNISLPATKLAPSCYGGYQMGLSSGGYWGMFSGCKSLTSAPAMAPIVVASSSCENMFSYCESLIDVSGISLPATMLASSCYAGMFNGCKSLTTAPAIAPTTVAESCCENMFKDCSVLTDISGISLPATTLASNCYARMFSGCSMITSAPAMSPTIFADSCCESMFSGCIVLSDVTGIVFLSSPLKYRSFYSMFSGCRNLEKAPVLSLSVLSLECCANMFLNCVSLINVDDINLAAESLSPYCYSCMFKGCVNLVNAPELPALNLMPRCYYSMFMGCSSLNYVKAMFVTTPGVDYTENWLDGVSSSGDFILNDSASWNLIGSNGIPSGWNIYRVQL